jgi:RHS repeat-associated protein
MVGRLSNSPSGRTLRRVFAVVVVVSMIPLLGVVAAVSRARPADANAASDYQTAVLADSPAAYWRLNETSGTTANDLAGSHNGTVSGAVTVATSGPMAPSMQFTSNGQVATSYMQTSVTAYSVEAWIKTTDTGVRSGSPDVAAPLVQDRGALGSGAKGLTLALGTNAAGTTSGNIRFVLDADYIEVGVVSLNPVNDGQWHHVVGAWSGSSGTVVTPSQFALYIDGVASTPTTQYNVCWLGSGCNAAMTAPFTGSGGTKIARSDVWNTNVQAQLAEVAIYNSALSSSAVLAHMIASQHPVGGPSSVSQSNSPSVPHSESQACRADPVNTATGNFSDSFTDLVTPGRGVPLNVTRTYNAQIASADAPFGHGWSFPYGMTFSQTSSTALVTEEGGTTVAFNRSGSTYTPAAPRFAASLTDNGNGTVSFKRLNREFFTFNTTGLLQSEQDLNGKNASTPYSTTFSYTSGKLSTATDPAGRTYTFGWTGSHITSLTDSSSPARTITYVYDGSGNLTDVYGVNTTRTPSLLNNDRTVFTYDGSHRMLTMRSPKYYGSTITPNPVTTNVYDTSSRVTSQTDPLGQVTTFDYTTVPGSTITTDPKGNATRDEYADGLLKSCTLGYGTGSAATTSFSYDPVTLGLVQEVDPNSHTSSATYDSAGNQITATDALGRTMTYTYNSYNEVTSIIEPKTFGGVHASTTFGYDEAGHSSSGAGNLTSTSSPLINGSGTTTATQVTYLNHSSSTRPGDVTSVVDPDGNTTTFAYDSYGNRTSATAPATPENGSGNQTLYGYDTAKGWVTSIVSPRGVLASVTTSCTPPALGCTTFAHDAWGHVTTITDPLGHTTVAHYDANGNQDSATDANGNVTGSTFDAANQLTTVTRADTTQLTNDYYADGSLHHQYDAASNATTYTYDPIGRVSTITDPNSHTTTYTYDAVGNPTGKADPGGSCSGTITTSSKCTSSTYNSANELTGIFYSDGVTPNVSSITYDAAGQRTAMTDGTGSSAWTYNSLHRLTSSTNGAGNTIGYSYNLRGQPTTITYPGSTGAVTRTYDAIGRIASITDWLSNQTTFTYNADSVLTSQISPNGTTNTNTLNSADQLTGVSDAPTSTPGSPFVSFAYGRDNAGQVSSVTSTGVPTDNNTYGYNTLNQLHSVSATTYGYNSADDLTGLNSGATQGFDPANQLCWTSSSGGTGACGSPPSGATAYTSDNRGNRTQRTPGAGGPDTYTYDQASRLTAVNGTATYAYDGDGIRQSKIVGSTTTTHTWDRSGSLPLDIQDNSTSYIYTPDGQPLEQINGSTVTYYHHDQQGSTRALTNTSGTVIGTYTYDAYGNPTGSTGSVTQPFGYNGQYTDTETGFQYLRARYYEPATGQFLTRDPLASLTRSAFGYAKSNPLNSADPTGLCVASSVTGNPECDQWLKQIAKLMYGDSNRGIIERYQNGLKYKDAEPGHVQAFEDLQRGLTNNLGKINDFCLDKAGNPPVGTSHLLKAARTWSQIPYPGTAGWEGGVTDAAPWLSPRNLATAALVAGVVVAFASGTGEIALGGAAAYELAFG